MEQITNNVFIETGVRGCNPGFVVTSDGIVMVDAGIDLDYANIWHKEIAKRGQVRFIVNTEHHMDHWVANSVFDGEIISHEATREAILSMDVNFIKMRTEVLYSEPLPIPAGYQLRAPNVTYSERLTLFLGEQTIELIHTPGHTLGQTAVYIPKEKVLFTGDNVFFESRTAFHDGDLESWLKSIEILKSLDARFIVPGHGTKACDKGYLDTQASVLRALIEAGQSSGRADESLTLDEETYKKADPFYATLDTGIKPSLKTLSSTKSAVSTGDHGK